MKKPLAFYNEIDPFAAQWLRNLIAAGVIAPGDVDERDIRDIKPKDLDDYTQCHFFAGIGVWSYALRRGGWSDDRPVWTGSCPCQPFSAAGERTGEDDERHLWPSWFHLIDQCRPPVVFGEQVASKPALAWIDLVHADLEGAGYTVGALDLCSAGVGAPNIRQRLFYVADRGGAGLEVLGEQSAREECETVERSREADELADTKRGGRGARGTSKAGGRSSLEPDRHGADGVVADTNPERRGREHALLRQRGQNEDPVEATGCCEAGDVADSMPTGRTKRRSGPRNGSTSGSGEPHRLADPRGAQARGDAEDLPPWESEPSRGVGAGLVADTDGGNAGAEGIQRGGQYGQRSEDTGASDSSRGSGPLNGFWRDADWLRCRDGKWRPVEPGTFPLVTGAPARVGRLRGYGNAINAEVAIQFIKAYKEVRP